MRNYYCVAGHLFCLEFKSELTAVPDLSQYAPFAVPQPEGEPVFTLTVVDKLPELEPVLVLDQPTEPGETKIKLFRCGEQWYSESSVTSDHPIAARLLMSGDFTDAKLEVCGGADALFAVNNSLMLLYAMRSAAGDTLLFHSSTIVKDGKAYLFLGKSGTGKSTHSGLWLKHIEGTRLLNDDNPVVYISHEGTPMVSGSPWSGKTPCYKNEEYPIGAIVQLRQAPENKIRKQTVIESYVSIKTSVSGKAWEKEIADGQHQTIEKLIGATRLYQLDCLPDADAALLCSQTISL